MDKFKGNKIIDEVMYYVENPDVTYNDVASKFGKSVDSIKKHFKSFKENSDASYSELRDKLNDKICSNERKGKSKGGSHLNSGKDLSISDDRLLSIFNLMLKYDYTFSELEVVTNIPKSTLQDNISRIKKLDSKLYDDLDLMLYKHKKGIGLK